MRWLEEHCADRATTPGMVLCSQQRRKVTISLAEEVRKRHGMVGQAVVGFHVSKNRSAGLATRLMFMTEAIGLYALINNRALKPAHPVTIVVADEVHERTMALLHTFWHFSTLFHTFSEFFRIFPPGLFLRIKGFYCCFSSKTVKENKRE